MTETADLTPPRRPLSAQLFDILLWGGVALLLIISFHPAEIDKFPMLFSSESRMGEFVGGFFAPYRFWDPARVPSDLTGKDWAL